MDISVLYLDNTTVTVNLVYVLQRHGALFCLKNWGLIHVNPIVVDMIGSIEIVRRVQATPVFSRFRVQIINPDTGTRPRLTFVHRPITSLHKIVRIRFSINFVLLADSNMRISNNNQSSGMVLNLLVHFGDFCLWKLPLMKHEIIDLVLCVAQVEPKHVYWEPKFLK